LLRTKALAKLERRFIDASSRAGRIDLALTGGLLNGLTKSALYGALSRIGMMLGHATMLRTQQYLKAHRRKAALTLEEMGLLLGLSAGAVSQYELGKRRVPAEVMVACEAIFGTSASKIFPTLVNSVEEDLAVRTRALRDRLIDRVDLASKKKLALIGGIPSRLH
jgi:transcriptional regulator with XRE-family HTH domain